MDTQLLRKQHENSPAWWCCHAFSPKPCLKAVYFRQLWSNSNWRFYQRCGFRRSLRWFAGHSSAAKQDAAVELRKLKTINDMVTWGEEQLKMGLFLMALMVMVVLLLLVHIKTYRKLLGAESSLTAFTAQMHFSIPCLLLLTNTLIITSSGSVHSQELLGMD